MKIGLAQINPMVGDFGGNLNLIKQAYERAEGEGVRLLLTPELSLSGYACHDLLHRREMIPRCEAALEEAARLTQGKQCALVVGHVSKANVKGGKSSHNSISVLQDGKVVFTQHKTLLPTYDVFDEARYFEPAPSISYWECEGRSIAFSICEDLWGTEARNRDPVDFHCQNEPDLLISISASPFQQYKPELREEVHGEVARRVGCPLVYINQVGATDEVIFDGGSFALSEGGEPLGRLKFFETDFGVVDLDTNVHLQNIERPTPMESLAQALTMGIRDYFGRTGFSKAVLGLSGGIDSALVATLAVRALGAPNVTGVIMPSQYSSTHSVKDAEDLARNLGIKTEYRPIKFVFSQVLREMRESRPELSDLAQENIQARLRGLFVMTLANNDGSLALATGNKSELALGYCTQYGDMVGALAPIGDVYKTKVYELSRYLNTLMGDVIPESTLTKAPSAELKPGQTDQDTLPPYDLVDAVLEEYIESKKSFNQLLDAFPNNQAEVRRIVNLLEATEFKRRQAAPGIKVSPRAFGQGRRIPLAKRWDLSL